MQPGLDGALPYFKANWFPLSSAFVPGLGVEWTHPPELLPPVLWGFAGGAADLGCLVGAEWWERGVCSVLMDIPTWFQTFLKALAGDFKCS